MADENRENPGQLLIYHDGGARLQVRVDGATVWLSQRLMSELYQVSVKTVNEHLQNIYEEGELSGEGTIRNFRIVQTEGQRQVERDVEHYNLDARTADKEKDQATSRRLKMCSPPQKCAKG